MTEGSQDEVVDENRDIELRSTSTTTFGYVRVDNSSYTNDKYTNAILFNLLKKPPKILPGSNVTLSHRVPWPFSL